MADDRLEQIEQKLATLERERPHRAGQIKPGPTGKAWREQVGRRQDEQRAEAIRRDRAIAHIHEQRREETADDRARWEKQAAKLTAERDELLAEQRAVDERLLARKREVDQELAALEQFVNSAPSATLFDQALAMEPEIRILSPGEQAQQQERTEQDNLLERLRDKARGVR